ncbi:MAG: FISUMP domain-containing protein [Bacteroidales bacterium]
MNKESVSKKISELFDLYKAGAVSKEEYEKLKKQIFLDNGTEIIENVSLDNGKTTEVKSQKTKNKWQFHKVVKIGIGLFLIALVFLIYKFSRNTDSVKDIDGNVYQTIIIRDQIWMKENLKTTRYNDGKPIPLVTDNGKWGALKTPAYCWYNNNMNSNKNTYGALYNWYAIDTKKLCPKGWHVPSTEEWTMLIYSKFENGSLAGGSLKEAGTQHWASPNTLATNSTGFTALPGGYRFSDFYLIGKTGFWWTSEEYNEITSWFGILEYDQQVFRGQYDNKQFGGSVRCVKN